MDEKLSPGARLEVLREHAMGPLSLAEEKTGTLMYKFRQNRTCVSVPGAPGDRGQPLRTPRQAHASALRRTRFVAG
jgi:hypothetical protein